MTSVTDESQPVVRDTATVLVTAAVDGRKRRRKPSARRTLAVTLHEMTVLPEVMAAAHAARRVGERLHLVSETEVWLVPEVAG